MSEYAVVKSLLSCLSSSFVFSLNPGKDRAYLGSIRDNLRQAIGHQGLSVSTQMFLHQLLEHLKSFEAETIDSTELDFLIDTAKRDIWQPEDRGIRVFVDRPSVSVHAAVNMLLMVCKLSGSVQVHAIEYNNYNSLSLNQVYITSLKYTLDGTGNYGSSDVLQSCPP